MRLVHVSPGTAEESATTAIEPAGWVVGSNPINSQLVFAADREDATEFEDDVAERMRRSLVAKGHHVELYDAT